MDDTKDYRYRIELIIIDTRVVPVFRSTAVVGPGTVLSMDTRVTPHNQCNTVLVPLDKKTCTSHDTDTCHYPPGTRVPLVPEYSSSAKLSGSRILSIFRFSIPGTSTELENPEQ